MPPNRDHSVLGRAYGSSGTGTSDSRSSIKLSSRCLKAVCSSGQLSSVVHAQLGKGTVQVALHSGDRNEQPLRYLGVGQVLADKEGHLLL